MKGTARIATNIKPMAGGNTIATLPVGGWIYGDKGTTDLMNFTHWYRPSGQKMELDVLCKATLGNLILKDEVEPGIEPPPDTDPTVPPTDTFPPYIPIGGEMILHYKIDGQITDTFTFVRTS